MTRYLSDLSLHEQRILQMCDTGSERSIPDALRPACERLRARGLLNGKTTRIQVGHEEVNGDTVDVYEEWTWYTTNDAGREALRKVAS